MGDPRHFDRITRADVRVFFLLLAAIAALAWGAWIDGQDRELMEKARNRTPEVVSK